MKNILVPVLTTLYICLFSLGTAHSYTLIEYSDTINYTGTFQTMDIGTMSVAKFDNQGGTLTLQSVTIELDTSISNITETFSNISSPSVSETVNKADVLATLTAYLTTPATNLVVTYPEQTKNGLTLIMPTNTSTAQYNFTGSNNDTESSGVLTDPTILTAFTGSDNITVPLNLFPGNGGLVSGGPASFSATGNIIGDLIVTYNYTDIPIPSVPEPSTLILFGLGTLCFGGIIARKRRR